MLIPHHEPQKGESPVASVHPASALEHECGAFSTTETSKRTYGGNPDSVSSGGRAVQDKV